MRLTTSKFAACLLLSLSAGVESGFAGTALEAVKALPKEAAPQLARIEGRGGKPEPDRWYLLVHDPKAVNGLREYVITGGEIVATRELSQFAEKLTQEDVLGEGEVKIDSDAVAKLVQDFAKANNVKLGPIKYELHKQGAEAAPVWKVTCVDQAELQLGILVLTAGKGTLVSHDGFAKKPENATASAAGGKSKTKSESKTEPRSSETPKPQSKPKSTPSAARKKERPERLSSETVDRPDPPVERGVEVRRAEPLPPEAEEEPARRSTLQRVGESARRLLPF
ncbi:MAG TPA: hypothetical protein VF614_02120 [Chthoniobacteraceae bacterium]|jgi:hypothetical protein